MLFPFAIVTINAFKTPRNTPVTARSALPGGFYTQGLKDFGSG